MSRRVLIATLPKSGTWYCKTFFWCYSRLVKSPGTPPDLLGMLREGNVAERVVLSDSLGIDELYICHALCPGYEVSGDTRHVLWQGLSLPLPVNGGDGLMRKHGSWEALNPAANPDARILYLYRNPLDHFVSFYNHLLNHSNDEWRGKVIRDGASVPHMSIQEFLFDFGVLGGFIKLYYSFREMHRRYPAQVKMIAYADLTKEPQPAFSSMLAFMGIPAETREQQAALTQALSMCSKESMMAIEAELGRSLGGDQKPGGRHVRDGKIGKWREYFKPPELQRIEAALNLFDISLKDFPDIGDAEALFALTEEDKQRYQKEFLGQQEMLAHRWAAELRAQPVSPVAPAAPLAPKRLSHYLPRFIRRAGRLVLNKLRGQAA